MQTEFLEIYFFNFWITFESVVYFLNFWIVFFFFDFLIFFGICSFSVFNF